MSEKAAKSYAKHAQAKRSELSLNEIKLPSGFVWKLADPPIQQFVMSGKLPSHLAAKMAAAIKASGGDVAEAQKKAMASLSPEDIIANLEFGRDLLLACAIEPRISLEHPVPDDAVAPEDILPEDFSFLLNWVMKGGESGNGLDTFRGESGKRLASRSRSS
jgi:hypothetical protein